MTGAAALILNGTKIFFVNENATFIDGSAILLNKEPKNPPDWFNLNIRVLNNFILVGVLFSNEFFNYFFLSCCQ